MDVNSDTNDMVAQFIQFFCGLCDHLAVFFTEKEIGFRPVEFREFYRRVLYSVVPSEWAICLFSLSSFSGLSSLSGFFGLFGFSGSVSPPSS
jgi:hypothetical protein